MTRLKIMYTFIMLCFCSIIFAQQKKEVHIQGTITNLPDGHEIVLTRTTEGNTSDTVLSTTSKDSKFEFSDSFDLNGQIYFIQFKRNPAIPQLAKKNWIRVIMDTTHMSIEGDLSKWPAVDIKASNALAVYENYQIIRDRIVSRFISTSTPLHMRDSLEAIASSVIVDTLMDYGRKYNYSLATPYLALRSRLTVQQKEELYNLFPPYIQSSFAGKMLMEDITNTKLGKKIAIGNFIPNFTVEGKNGEQIGIYDIVKNYNFTLIDFWAYWCAPCKADVPDMKKVYSAFHDKGFNILSISIDPKYDPWVKALKELNTPWDNAIDKTNRMKKLFSIKAIPAYILLDRQGKILAIDMIGFETQKAGYTSNKSNSILSLRREGLDKSIKSLITQKD